jgi:hypothetical protein
MTSDKPQIDTIVVPARRPRFEDLFMGKSVWRAVPISKDKRDQLKYIAAYVTKPESKITHYAEVARCRENDKLGEEHKAIVEFQGLAKPIGPIPRLKGSKNNIRSSRYTTFEKLSRARNIDDLFK